MQDLVREDADLQEDRAEGPVEEGRKVQEEPPARAATVVRHAAAAAVLSVAQRTRRAAVNHASNTLRPHNANNR